MVLDQLVECTWDWMTSAWDFAPTTVALFAHVIGGYYELVFLCLLTERDGAQ